MAKEREETGKLQKMPGGIWSLKTDKGHTWLLHVESTTVEAMAGGRVRVIGKPEGSYLRVSGIKPV